MASAKTESRIDIGGEITESAPTPPARSVWIFEIHYDGTFHLGVDSALKELGFVRRIEPDGRILYIEDNVPSESDKRSEELPLREGESPARSGRILVLGLRTVGSIQYFMEGIKERAVDGVQFKFVVGIHPPCAIFFVREKDDVQLSNGSAAQKVGEEVAEKFKELFAEGDPRLKEQNMKERHAYGVQDELSVVAINTTARPYQVCVNMPHIPKADVPFYTKFAGWTMEKLAEKREWLPIGGESATESVPPVGDGFWASSTANLAGPSWPMYSVEGDKLAMGGDGLWNHSPSLSKAMIKAAAMATASGIIIGLATPLPLVVALPVGLAGWVIVATTVLLN